MVIQVLKWMPNGRRVRVEPKVYFSELSSAAPSLRGPPPHAFGPFSVLGVKDAQPKESKATVAAASSAIAAFSGVSALKGFASNKKAPAPENAAAVAAGGQSEDDRKVKSYTKVSDNRAPGSFLTLFGRGGRENVTLI